ncbi:site-specific integrase [Desulfovibrio sp. JC022]|uniref:tyrosine-type recombinase/integrase n=1 Tax=Desulfovibrio sp. JC022 TaxID=2593642 RepID=UPI0013D26B5F|nr:site-specific integrase [Desulfovibrio sp. JC022]NDV24303.1 tyrosine-type recombinase/integrase [Desulfovibrio sp. JC022]
MRKWITSAKYPGIRWYEHSTRKHGPRPDRCFGLRYSHNGKRYQPTLGWASAGWTEAKAALTLAELKENIRTGEGCISLTEKRELAEKKREEKAIKKAKDKKASVTYSQFWEKYYWPQQKHKAKGSVRTEEGLYRNWIAPFIGDMPLSEVRPKDIEKIKTALLKKKRATSTIKYTFGTISHLWNMARRDEYVHGDSPTTKISVPKHDNRRERFLTPEEAKTLLAELKQHRGHTHDMALLALRCGLRFGEIAALTWHDLDLEGKKLSIRDTKGKVNRQAYLLSDTLEMLSSRFDEHKGPDSDLIFPSRNGKVMDTVSNIFPRIVNPMFNEGVTDKRLRVYFHTLRHTFASWLVQRGVDLYSVKELMGHEDFKMTQRYSHLSPDGLMRAVEVLEE